MWRWTAGRLLSFRHAIRGLHQLVRDEPNARIHATAAGVVLISSWWLKLNATEWVLVVFCIALVFITEAVNTAIEQLCDFVSLEQHPRIGQVKDLSAAAVLIAAVTSVFVACCVFIPKFAALVE